MAIWREFRVQGFEKRVRGFHSEAVRSVRSKRQPGLGHVICDNESFLMAPQSRAEYKRLGIRLWPIPPRSPDLNPVELFWSWLKRDLAKRDLQDLLARRAVLSKEDYRRRIQGILRGSRAQQVAAACTKSFRKACTLVVKNSGGAGK